MQNESCSLNIFLPHIYGTYRCSSYPHKGTKCDNEVHQRKSNGETGDSHCPHTMPDKNTVDNII